MMRSRRLGIDVALLGQDGFERPHAQLHLGELRAVVVRAVLVMVPVVVMVMIVIVVIVVVAGHGTLRRIQRIVRSFVKAEYPPGRRT